jgi:hypothetical protein
MRILLLCLALTSFNLKLFTQENYPVIQQDLLAAHDNAPAVNSTQELTEPSETKWSSLAPELLQDFVLSVADKTSYLKQKASDVFNGAWNQTPEIVQTQLISLQGLIGNLLESSIEINRAVIEMVGLPEKYQRSVAIGLLAAESAFSIYTLSALYTIVPMFLFYLHESREKFDNLAPWFKKKHPEIISPTKLALFLLTTTLQEGPGWILTWHSQEVGFFPEFKKALPYGGHATLFP